ncbi:MAG: TIGR00341 family protein [Erythrobacteraceae bacterium]|nr:TIGR00341 family protein [Erythrobacteraceae bacterium]|tara:strand:+ start:4073 stop:5647 length:1575 start_codon:yes stop_codon:yes gene_type:complete
MQTPSSASATSDPQNSTNGPSDSASTHGSRLGIEHILTDLTRWWRVDVSGTVDQAAVIEKRRAECELTARYLLMTCMSAGIAILGMLLSSPAVVIGAMLLSPLMDPIMGVGFALAIGDFHWLRRSVRSLGLGVGLAILFCAIIVVFSPIQTVTPEIASRTQPNLFDLMVAIFSAIAGGYAVIRGREGTIVGVAIATALMPPLAAVGYGLATWNWTVFSGALLLFVTNLTAIALTATAMARGYGFSTSLSEKQSQLQAFLIFAAFVALAVPLGLSLYRIGWEANTTRQINAIVIETFDGRARISDIQPDYNVQPIQVSATVLTPEIIGNAERLASDEMEQKLGQPVDVSITQLRVGTSAQAAEEAELANARAQEAEAAQRAQSIAERLALFAGVPTEDVTIDRQRRRALVTAKPLDGATLAAYRELERRVNATEPEWDIRIVPPLRALPEIPFGEEGELKTESRRALQLIIWAERRIGIPVRLSGTADQLEALRKPLANAGAAVVEDVSRARTDSVAASWAIPEG